jgi:N-acetylmuramoyl-L-alanine amidase
MTKQFSNQYAVFRLPASALLFACALSACAGSGKIETRSENFNSRVSIVVIHHTTANFADSLRILTQPSGNPVSSHYLIPEPNDPTYDRKKLETFSLVPETERAWHAGQSYWGGRTALNDQSIGIEIVNQTYCHTSAQPSLAAEPGMGAASNGTTHSDAPVELPTHTEATDIEAKICFFPDFSESQLELLLTLLADIKSRHPEIAAVNFVGHSDIAPGRKIDPGPRFPWQRLYQLGYGAWPDDATVIRYWERFRLDPPPLIRVQQALSAYGYGIDVTGEYDEQTRDVVSAFQLHFRPADVSGALSPDTVAILFALIEKYFPERLGNLLEAPTLVPLP